MSHYSWKLYSFSELRAGEIYEILRLRSEIFIVEQNCPYQDIDNKDEQSFHFCGWNEKGELVAYTRILPKDLAYPGEPSIGRVLVKASYRGGGLGRELMQRSIEIIREKWGNTPIRIGAQAYLRKMYESLGFRSTDNDYVEDGIPHLEMLYEVK